MDRLLARQTTEGQLILNFMVNTDKAPANSQSVAALKARLALLESYWAKVLNRHCEMDPTEEQRATEPYWTKDQFSLYEQNYIQHVVTLKERIALLEPEAPQIAQSPGAPTRVMHDASAPLRKLPLPTFNGDVLQWAAFKERFSSLVGNVASYSKVTKLQYLQSCLEGPAAKRVNNMEITGANYDVAWAKLVKRYDNERITLSAHLSKMLKLPTTPQRTAAGISGLLDEVDEALAALKHLGRPVDQWDDWLIEIITARLDSSIIEDWEKSQEGNDILPTYGELVDFLETRIRSLESAHRKGPEPSSSSTVKPTPSKKQAPKERKSVNSYHSSSTEASANPRSKRGCSICKGEHFIGYCPNFVKLEPERRRELVSSTGLCFNCLSGKHIVAKCTSKGRCSTRDCEAKHHSLLRTNRSLQIGMKKL
ncbi:uncharacterized protein LOC108627373 [Ceratina calcarata]|uniref:Uncharacterized protein LOC108627373 n=1 Tax=Ceratina calcarata TaxID=156304 RepID=A0AAJ7J3P2_9HYME|nr:uncharacterized protein LOC108627373 [Ceratina calcarata]